MEQYMSDLSALDAALAELDAIEGESLIDSEDIEVKGVDSEVISENSSSDVDEKILEGVANEIELEEAVRESYAEIEPEKESISPKKLEKSSSEIGDDVYNETSEVKEKDVEVESKPKPKAKSRAGGAMKPSEALKVRLGSVEAVESTLIHTPEDAKLSADELKETIAARMAEIDSAPKKVGEKLVNAYAHLTGGTSLSVYTELALELILTKGEITSQDIFERYRARPYSEGTSRSQSGQLMKVLPLMGVAKREGQKLTLVEDSVIAQAFAENLGIERTSAKS